MKNIILILLAFISVLFTACQDDIILDLDGQVLEKITVDASLSNIAEEQSILISRTSDYYNTDFRNLRVTGATVTVSVNGNDVLLTENDPSTSRGRYSLPSNFTFNVGDEVSLRAEVDGEILTASQIVEKTLKIDSITFSLSSFVELGFSTDTTYDIIAHYAPVETEKEGFYLFNLYYNGKLQTTKPSERTIRNVLPDATYISRSIGSVALEDLEKGEWITVEVWGVNEDFARFYSILFNQVDLSGNPFAASPPANVPTNITNGLGYFIASDVDTIGRKFLE